MPETAYLILENGKTFKGEFFGAVGDALGEVVFTTGMTGYLETLTDKSYYGQIILQTFPLIGNYGVIPADFESADISANGYIVRELCHEPSNFRSRESLDELLKRAGISGICGIDTRAVTRIIRENGVMNGIITGKNPDEIDIDRIGQYKIERAVPSVSTKSIEVFKTENSKYKIALLDFGLKENIKRELLKRGCEVWVFPHDTKPSEISAIKPDGIMLSNGPGDPAENTEVIESLKELIKTKIPIFGICLGHQLLALANGFSTHKLKYGHRGSNQPVKDTASGKVYVTSQNHGYSVDKTSIYKGIADCSFINANDFTCEGIDYKNAPVFSVQFHPEASAGPLDTAFLFDRFINTIDKAGGLT